MHYNSSYDNSSLLIKILAWLTLIAFGFVLFHLVMIAFGFVPRLYMMEIYFDLQNGIPVFLFLTGTFIQNKTFRIASILLLSVFFFGYLINAFDSYGFFDEDHLNINIRGMKYVMGASLLPLLVLYSIHFIQKPQKTALDFLKISWFACIGYNFLSGKFPIGFHAFYFFIAAVIIFPFLMGIGLFRFFYPKKILAENND